MAKIKLPSIPVATVTAWLIAVAVFSFVFYRCVPDLVNTYHSKFQVPLFAGFLTLGSFPLTLKSFVVIQFKKELFDRASYKEAHHALYNKYVGKTYYEPLNNLAQLLLISVIASVITSISQLTIGFISLTEISALCLGLAIATLCQVGFVWYHVRRNVLGMFEWWEKDLEAENKKDAIS